MGSSFSGEISASQILLRSKEDYSIRSPAASMNQRKRAQTKFWIRNRDSLGNTVDNLFVLRQSLAAYRYFQRLLQECDREVRITLKAFDSRVDVKRRPLPPERTGKRKPRRNEPQFNLRQHLYRIFGVDLTQIPGLQATTAHILLAEIGPNLSKFRSSSALASWLALRPHNDISGGKILWLGPAKLLE